MKLGILVVTLWTLAVAGLVYAARTSLPLEQPVTCCCRTSNGLCCAEQSICGGVVLGCFCN